MAPKAAVAVEVYEMPESVQAGLGMANLLVRFWHSLGETALASSLVSRSARALAWCEEPDSGDCPEEYGIDLRVLVEFRLAWNAIQEASIGYTAATIDIARAVVEA